MKTVLVGLVMLASPALAETPTLWGSLKAGMTPQEVKQVAPETIALSTDCVARVDPSFKAGRLDSIMLKYTNEGRSKCGETLRDSLTAKYGEPSKKTIEEPVPYNTPKVSTTYTYRNGPVRIDLRLREDNGKWWITYSGDTAPVASSNL